MVHTGDSDTVRKAAGRAEIIIRKMRRLEEEPRFKSINQIRSDLYQIRTSEMIPDVGRADKEIVGVTVEATRSGVR